MLKDSVTLTNINYHENPLSGNRVSSCGPETGGHDDANRFSQYFGTHPKIRMHATLLVFLQIQRNSN
jgi:hypothetical protein